MAPDIDVYAPYVEAVFGAAPAGRHIPRSIADRSRQGSDPLVRVLIALLGFPASRLKASEVLGLLEVPAVMRRFGLDAEAVERLRGWVRDSGARWGLDGMDRDALGLQADDSHSWAFGLRRLLLGYALPPERRLFRGVLPLAGVEGTQGEDLGVLAEFLARVGLWRERLGAARRPAEWQETLNRLLDDFVHPDEDQAYLLQELRDVVGELVAKTGAAGLDRPLAARAGPGSSPRHSRGVWRGCSQASRFPWSSICSWMRGGSRGGCVRGPQGGWFATGRAR
jgi:exodeoxyribonuclease V gamma subunit